MKQQTKNKLSSVKTLGEYLNVLQSEFKCSECKPGRLIRNTLIRTILSKLNGSNVFVNENVRIKCLEAENMDKFINTIKSNFNVNVQFSEQAREKLESDTNALILLTGLKEK